MTTTPDLIGAARHIPTGDAAQSLSISTVTLPAPGRDLPLELRMTAPLHENDLPIILLSHGGGDSLYLPSKDGYDPLVRFWAERGFAVLQPTHLSSKIGGRGLDPRASGFPIFWRSRIDDLTLILDNLPEIEARVPVVAGRLDHDRVAAVGHSAGTHTVGMLLGAQLDGVSLREPRIKAGVLLAPLGNGGDDLTEAVRARFPELHLDYTNLTTQTLVVYGDADLSPALTVRGADWHADPYHHGPGADSLLTLFGAKHFLGGIMGYDVRETDDEDPERLAIIQRMSWAYLRSAVHKGDPAWPAARKAFEEHAAGQGRIDTKPSDRLGT